MRRNLAFVLGGLAVAAVLGFWVSRCASSEPDGLEKVASDTGLDRGERTHALAGGPLADYSVAGVEDHGSATGLAGLFGVAVTFAIAAALVWTSMRVRRRTSDDAGSAGSA